MKWRQTSALTVLLALAAGLAPAADPPAIQGEAKVAPYRLVKLKVVNVPDKAGLLWKVRPQDPKATAADLDWATGRNRADLAFVGPPGKYLVELTIGGTAADGSFALDGTDFLVEIQSPLTPDPPPAPAPSPGPAPTPTPTGTGAWVIVVADEAAPSPAQAKVIDGPTLRALKAAGKCRVYGSATDADKLAAKRYDALLAEAKVTAPALIVLDKAGGKVLAVALPADEAALAAALKGVVSP